MFNIQLGRLQVKPPSCKIKHAKMVQQINEARWGGKEQYKKAHLIQRKWKCRGLATLASAVKEKKKKDKYNQQLSSENTGSIQHTNTG